MESMRFQGTEQAFRRIGSRLVSIKCSRRYLLEGVVDRDVKWENKRKVLCLMLVSKCVGQR
jgi:hypothetical protein